MLCSRCKKNEANVMITQIINGQKHEFHVCSSCGEQLGLLSSGIMVNMSDFISGFVGKGLNVSGNTTCPSCGTTLGEFTKTSKLGCGKCYETFSVQLENIMKKMHGSTVHTGKFPSQTETSILKKRRLKSLRDELAAEVKCENFERAAKLRDEIRQLSAEIGE